jgi:protease-4
VILPAHSRPGSGSGWKWLAAGLGLVLVASVAFNFLLGLPRLGHLVSREGHTSHSGSQLVEVVLEDDSAREKIAVIDVNGVISDEAGRGGSSLVDSIKDQLDRAADDERVKAVILRVDSPGGEVLASDEIYRALHRFQTNTDIPVIASMGSIAASGGYYISAPCRWIVANELTITGSIGVIFHTYNYRGLMDKVGVRPGVVKSGKLKDMLSPDKRAEDELPEERAILSGMIDESFARFVSIIVTGRGWAAKQNEADKITEGRTLAANWRDFADGRILSGNQALNLGLVDEIGNFDTAVARALALANIDAAKVVTYEAAPNFSNLLRLLGKTENRAFQVNVGGIDLSPRLPQGRLYFMSPLHLH